MDDEKKKLMWHPVDHSEGLLVSTIEMLEAQLAALRHKMDHVEVFDESLAAQAASLGRAVASVGAEARKLRDHRQKLGQAMSPDEFDAEVVEFVRGLEPERRDKLKAAVAAIEADGDERPLLG